MRLFRTLLPALLVAILVATTFAQDESVWSTKKSGWQLATPPQRTEAFQLADQFKSYLDVSRSALQSNREVIRLARAAGFAEFTDAAQIKPGARLIVNNRDRAVILAIIGSDAITAGTRVVATHQDSPHIDLKSRPVVNSNGMAMLKTIYYGGIKKYQWANIPLALVGRIDTSDGRTVDVSIGTKPGEPVFVIPDNAPHSDKPLRTRTYDNELSGEELNPVFATIPNERGSVVAEALRALTTTYKIKEEDLVSAELSLVPAAPPADSGIDRGLVAAAGQDDRLSSWCAARSILDVKGTPRQTAMAYLTNFEEEGSGNNTGAQSEFLYTTYARLIAGQQGGKYSDLDLRTALRNSLVISADTNDGINPIFGSTTSEVSNAARLGWGPAVKTYGGQFDAPSELTARLRGLLDRNAIPWQTQTPKVDVGGGGTIGGFLARHDMNVIDFGVPIMSMHSPYEMSSKIDVWNFYRLMHAFYQWDGK